MVSVEFCGEVYEVIEGGVLTIGRDADLAVDDNRYLHRRFLTVTVEDGLCLLSNVGTRLAATASDPGGHLEAFLGPGSVLPLVFETTVVTFSAGPTMYEIVIRNRDASFRPPVGVPRGDGEVTLGSADLTPDQRRLILALAEAQLTRHSGEGAVIPSTAEAAARLGWTTTKFNRKLDNVCDKLTRLGVRGLHGRPGALASNRRARLVEYAIATRLVTREHLVYLDRVDADSEVVP